jgi:hypothetical protein
VSGLALAAQPTSETIVLDDHFVDTELCADFDVQFDGTGHIRLSQHVDRDGNLVMEVNNYAIKLSWSANGNVVNAVDTGLDHAIFGADGSLKFSVIGNLQLITGGGAGVLAGETGINLVVFDAEGNVVREMSKGKKTSDDRAAAICELLAS